MHDSEETKRLMAWMIWGEAQGECLDGKIAVAQVVTNRLRLAHRPIRPVRWWGWTYQDILRHPFQFQGLSRVEDVNNQPPLDCYTVACLEIEGYLKPIVEGATHFVTVNNDKFKYSECFEHIATIGNHVFYKEHYP